MLKRLSQCIREYRKDTLLSPLFVSLEVIMEVLIPYLMSKIIDNGIDRGDMDYILRLGGVLVACALLSLLFGAFSGHFAANASSGFARNVRHDLYYAVQDFGFENIDRFSTSGLVTRLTTDVTNLQNAFQMIVRICVRAPVMLVFSLFMAFRVNSRLAMVFLAAAPVLVARRHYPFRVPEFPENVRLLRPPQQRRTGERDRDARRKSLRARAA